jgi:exodeoxyribonuclease III
MKVVSWNVNSVRARYDRLTAWVATNQPDVLCLQETKIETDLFPRDSLEALGYRVVHWGQRSYNGVAIASRLDMSDVVTGFGDDIVDPEARFIAATIQGVRIASCYIPNGQAVDSDKYAYKLAWYGRLRSWLERNADPAQMLVLCGDYNVAPEDIDVHDPAAWAGQIHCSEPERAAWRNLVAWGLVDTFRRHNTEGNQYSWWDYRGVSFFKNRGLRIDHLLATESLAARSTSCVIDREARKGQNASDHAPVTATFDVR